MAISFVGPRYRVTIPKQLREEVQLKVGDRISFFRKGDEIIMVKVPKDPLKVMAGSLKVKNAREKLREMKLEDLRAEEDRGL